MSILLIVESPTKSKTLQKFLDKNYSVISSYGHIRDLPQKKLGIDIEKDFKPEYVIPEKAKKQVKELKERLKKSKQVILATDEDREGEAIAFHLAEILELKNPQRIVFHEITKSAIEKALKKPRKININLVYAQQTRRILDRLVGYKLSPFLWKTIARGLSAGRVQSVALRLVAEREKEIESFKKYEYWTITGIFLQDKAVSDRKIEALLIKKQGKNIAKLGIINKEEAEKIRLDLKHKDYQVINIENKEIKKYPRPPFTTSTLQQESWQKLYFSAKKTMLLAQKLYEKGLITYHRTDSLNISEQSQKTAENFIKKNYGKEYYPAIVRIYKTKSKTAQEAHEAIRPTEPNKTPSLDKQQFKLYNLIWQRFIASQMKEACLNSLSIHIESKDSKYTFKANGQTIMFDGFLRVYPTKLEEKQLPGLKKGENLKLEKIDALQHFTQPPARYNEASLIKTLEKEGIGRPSTYAPILDTLQKRNYVEKNENKRLQPTEIGVLVNDTLVKHFPKIVDIKFTANMEENLDKIAKNQEKWTKVLEDFYDPFAKRLKEKGKLVSKRDLIKETEKICPKCGASLLMRWSRYGKFYGCSNYPKCKYIEKTKKPSLDIKCPKCAQGEIVEKRTRKGKIFYGCANWPDCDFALWDKPTKELCPECGSLLVEKGKKIVCSSKDCDFQGR